MAEVPAADQTLIDRWNDTDRAFPRDRCIHHGFEERVTRQPHAAALVTSGGTLTYDQLNRRANRIAHALLRGGARPGESIAVLMPRVTDAVAALLGILKAGCAYVPLDPAWPPIRAAGVIDHLSIGRAVTTPALAPALPVPRPLVLSGAGDLADLPDHNPPLDLGADSRAYVIFTSGSTGKPKGVLVHHRAVGNVIDWVNRTFDVSPADRLLFVTALTFDLSVYDLFGVLTAGASVRIAADEEIADPRRLLHILDTEPVTLWDSAPAALQRLFMLPADRAATNDRPLRLVLLSGDWIPLDLPAAVRVRFPAAHVVGLGGATEATVWSNWFPIGAVDPAWRSIPYGKPIQNARYYVLDDSLRPRPIGEAGELFIAGDCLAEGYANDPQRTAERFRADPSRPGQRMYRTGDLARWMADGNLELLGRVDHQVKVRGYRVELGEVEAALRSHRGVRQAVVDAIDDGAGNRRLVAWAAPAAGAVLDPGALRDHIARRLAAYMIPAPIIIVPEMPLGSSGKIDRGRLPRPGSAATHADTAADPPVGDTERALAIIWQRLLGCGPVGRHDSFFALGGDSLLSVRMIGEAAAAGLPVALGMVAARPTIAALAASLEPPSSPRSRDALTGDVPLTPTQHWIFNRRLIDPQHYSTAHLFEPAIRLDHQALREAADDLVTHHPGLRLRFARDGQAWRQSTGPHNGAIACDTVDLSTLLPDESPAALADVAARSRRSIDLERGPLVRLTLIDRGPHAPQRVLLVAHHLVFDGVSLALITEDLGASLDARAAGRPPLLPAAAPFQHWAAELGRRADRGDARHAADVFTAMPRADVTPLPTDHHRGPNHYAASRTVRTHLAADDVAALRHACRRLETGSEAAAILAATVTAFAHWAGATAVAVDFTAHGRAPLGPVDPSRTIGCLTTLYPLVIPVTANGSIHDAIRAAHRQHQFVAPHGLDHGLICCLDPGSVAARVLASLPCPEVKFNYQGPAPTSTPSLRPVPVPLPGVLHGDNDRAYLFNVEAFGEGAGLTIELKYCANLHTAATAQRLLEHIGRFLRDAAGMAAAARVVNP